MLHYIHQTAWYHQKKLENPILPSYFAYILAVNVYYSSYLLQISSVNLPSLEASLESLIPFVFITLAIVGLLLSSLGMIVFLEFSPWFFIPRI